MRYGASPPLPLKTLPLLILAAIALAVVNSRPAWGEYYSKRVLILNSYHRGFKWTDDITRGVESALAEGGDRVKIHYEYMDTKRVSGAAYFRLLRETYRLKFGATRLDAIVASDNDAFEFLLSHRDELFPGTPVVFCGVNDFQASSLRGVKLFTGVTESADLRATLELALRLHPSVRRILVINDTTTTGRIMHREIAALVPTLHKPVRLTFMEQFTLAEIGEETRRLGSDSLVLFTLFFRDREGAFIEYDEGISLIAPRCPVPIYGVWDFYLGNGIVGGKLTSGFSQGEAAGRLANRILAGEPVERLPVEMKSPNRFMYDYRQLYRFHIPTSALPPGSTIINSPVSRYSLPRNLVWGAVAALIGSVMIILFLLYNRMRRLRAEERSRRLAAIVDSSDDAIIGKTPDGIITSWNRGAELKFGYGEEEIIGKAITELTPPEQLDDLLRVHERIRRGEHVEQFEIVGVRKDGTRIPMSLTFSPVTDSRGRVTAFSTIGRDISERKRAERLLLENARISRELEIAHEIQQSFLKKVPDLVAGLRLASRCEPATQVGGDYYDLFEPREGVVDFVIADITGHSVGSALLMVETRSILQAKVTADRAPAKLLAEANDLLYPDLTRAEMQLSMFYARLDAAGRRLSYANAGHCRPLLYRHADGTVQELDADGLILGIMQGMEFEEKETGVERGDLLLMYTDGIVEAENGQGEAFGSERLAQLLAQRHALPPEELIDAILNEVSRFTGSVSRDDDSTLFAVSFSA